MLITEQRKCIDSCAMSHFRCCTALHSHAWAGCHPSLPHMPLILPFCISQFYITAVLHSTLIWYSTPISENIFRHTSPSKSIIIYSEYAPVVLYDFPSQTCWHLCTVLNWEDEMGIKSIYFGVIIGIIYNPLPPPPPTHKPCSVDPLLIWK